MASVKADREELLLPQVSVTQHAHQLIHENNSDMRFHTAEMWVSETTLVGRRNATARRLSQAMAVSEEEMASAFRSELHSSRSSLFSFPGGVAGWMDRLLISF